MNFPMLLLVLAIMGAACGCPDNCSPAENCQRQFLNHMSELHNSSVAPWTLKADSVDGREPRFLENAECMGCTVAHMVAKPIKIKIQVYKTMGNNNKWCRCPYELAVGCTCVREQSM